MSNEEFEKYKNGETLENHTDFLLTTNNTSTSKGFCFLNLADYTPEYSMHFLSGIVNFDICAVFEVNKKFLKKTHAQYAEPIEETGNYLYDLFNLYNRFNNKMTIYEYCTEKYNSKDFKLIKYCDNAMETWFRSFKNENVLEWKKYE